ncbi:DUF1624 domain-containing protein [Citrus sinensis]|uniref:DUF1624 domain-containing protein n=1 Tax=Citrus sinensis TaxID=2711 RepID=A0ACB8JQD0_CITSI|nr:DUF1624 domain-containing protein [Citrus sinensis]
MADLRIVEEGLGRTQLVEQGQDDGKDSENGINKEKGLERSEVQDEQKGELQLQQLLQQKSKRVATLDAFRGLTVVLMILVDDAGGAYARIDHSPWNGCTLADFVMPFFLFIVGVAIALALKKVPKINGAVKKIIFRTLKLLFWGIILQGGYSHAPDALSYGVDMKHIRWCGILQRIALVYLVVALIETLTTKRRPNVLEPRHLSIFTAYQWQWIGGFVAFVIYMITTYSLYVPNWSFSEHSDHGVKKYIVKCGMRGHLGPACNAVGYVDRELWGINHLYSDPVWSRLEACTLSSPNSGPLREDAPSWCRAPFEPEGLLRVTLRGSSTGSRWAIPINKQLYSFSYVCFTAGAAGIVFSALYVLMDVWELRTPFLFLKWIGMNAMLVFVLGAQGILAGFVNGWYYKNPDYTLVNWIQNHLFIHVWNSERLGTLLYVIFAEITFWGVVAGILHRLGVYWKL